MSVSLSSNKTIVTTSPTSHEIIERIKARTVMSPEQQSEWEARSAKQAEESKTHKFYLEVTTDEYDSACLRAREIVMTGLPDSISNNSKNHMLRSIEDVFMLEPVDAWFQSHAKNPNRCFGRIRSMGSEEEYLWIEVHISGTTDTVNFKLTWSDHLLPEDPREMRLREQREQDAKEEAMVLAEAEADWQYDEGDRA